MSPEYKNVAMIKQLVLESVMKESRVGIYLKLLSVDVVRAKRK